ncbi:hypothetical protein BGC07_16080 [Piscirickettsia litoralis]|uniref:Terminase n=2 Tax=Piscirickettsia litoralis TaxID=1891921 RepID=A0ABX2ZZF8_9GAMM|nr:hypothetical protein BGC07_16080 [Piscirickettsia litoralis]
MNKLSAKHKKFATEFLVDLNATQAAIRAGYSERTAKVQGARLLTNANIQEYIQSRQSKLQEKTEITQERVLTEYAKVAFSNMSDFANWSPSSVNLIDSNSLTSDKTACIAEITENSTENGSNIKIKLHDKLRALDALGRHLGLFVHKVEADINLNKKSDKEELNDLLFDELIEDNETAE